MPIGAKHSQKRGERRALRTPPHIPIRALRLALDITLDEVAVGVEEILGERPSRGTLSAIETGHRGASPELLSALEEFYRLDPGTISTTYRPRKKAVMAA